MKLKNLLNLLIVCAVPFYTAAAQTMAGGHSRKAVQTARSGRYDSYKGLVMAGYQGWFDTPEDGAGLGWRHLGGKNGFQPGSCNIDLWPDVSEYEKTYATPFRFADGTEARMFSSNDSTTVATHFRWMREYGIDGVFMQRFLADIRHPAVRRHFDRVLAYANDAARRNGRALCLMYDLSGMQKGGEQLLLSDLDSLTRTMGIADRKRNASWLWHNGKPLIAVWGVGFNDGRAYGLDEAARIIEGLKQRGFSILLGVPTWWRELREDTENDSRLHSLIRQCDIVMPWFVGRYDEAAYPLFRQLIKDDISWCRRNKVDYVPLCFPGFSWGNMKGSNAYVDRNGGRFFRKQLDGAIDSGAEMLYIAMFDEMDEGTAIFKCATRVPVAATGSTFVPLDAGQGSDYYLKLTGEAARKIKRNINRNIERNIKRNQQIQSSNRNHQTYIGNKK